MPNPDAQLAQLIYLANMFAQKGTCNCQACQLLRKGTDAMISQVLGGMGSIPGADLSQLIKGVTGGESLHGQVDPGG
jgi:branched-subunit amino acid ABC-type transport system permease component